MALGKPAAIPAKMMIEIPLPRPRSVICSPQPHQEHRSGNEGGHRRHAKHQARIHHQSGLRLECYGYARGLEERQQYGAVTGVLRDFALAGLPFFFQLFELRRHGGHQLHDNRRRYVRHDSQGKQSKSRQRATGEHVEHPEDATLLRLEQIGKRDRVDSRHRYMRTDAKND